MSRRFLFTSIVAALEAKAVTNRHSGAGTALTGVPRNSSLTVGVPASL